MTKTDWSALVRIADAKFKHETRALDALNMRTADLNARKSALRHLAGQAREELRSVHPALFNSGDVHWQTWVGRNAQALNMETAKLRVQREVLMPKVKKAFGRKLACDSLLEMTQKKRR